MEILCLDLEGVLIPEVWINVADRTGIDDLRLTTREIQDYDELMRHRLAVLDREGLKLDTITEVIDGMDVLDGSREFLDWARQRFQVAILSDTFYEFAAPFMRKLGWPLLLCHKLGIDDDGRVADYFIRQPDPKRQSVKAFRALNYRIIAAGDSFNDTSMLEEADAGIFFRAPGNVVEKFPQYPLAQTYEEFRLALIAASVRDLSR